MEINARSIWRADWAAPTQRGVGVPQGDLLAPLSNECISSHIDQSRRLIGEARLERRKSGARGQSFAAYLFNSDRRSPGRRAQSRSNLVSGSRNWRIGPDRLRVDLVTPAKRAPISARSSCGRWVIAGECVVPHANAEDAWEGNSHAEYGWVGRLHGCSKSVHFPQSDPLAYCPQAMSYLRAGLALELVGGTAFLGSEGLRLCFSGYHDERRLPQTVKQVSHSSRARLKIND